MSDDIENQGDEMAATAAPDDPETLEEKLAEDDAAEENQAAEESEPQAHESMPRWRQIEIMRERAQLREALGDLEDDFDEFDELEREVFGSESENVSLYQHGDVDLDEDIELDDEDSMDDEDFEEFEDD